MKTTVHIGIRERFGLSDELFDVVVTHTSFFDLSNQITNIYPNCQCVFIVMDDQTILDSAKYDTFIDGGSLTVGFSDRSIESTIVVSGKYGVLGDLTYMEAFPVGHNSFQQLYDRILQKMTGHTMDRLSILRAGLPVTVDENSYESLSPNGIITAYLTRPGSSNMGSYYSTIDAFSARVLNFNFATPKTSTTDTPQPTARR